MYCIFGEGVGGRSRHRYAKPKGSAHLGSNPTATTNALPHEVRDVCGMSKIKGGRLNFLLVCMCCCPDDSQLSAHSTVTCTYHELGASHTRFLSLLVVELMKHVFNRISIPEEPTITCLRHRGDSNPCGQSPMDFESISLATRTQCLGLKAIVDKPSFFSVVLAGVQRSPVLMLAYIGGVAAQAWLC